MLRFPECVVRVVPFVFVLALAPMAMPSGAQATALFSGESSATLTITGIENATTVGGAVEIEILGGTAPADPFSGDTFPFVIEEGTGTTTTSATLLPELTPPAFDDPTVLGLGDSLTLAVSGSGAADASGYAEVFAAAFGLITIDNFSTTDEVEISFELSFALSADASVDDPFLEDAIGDAGITAFSGFGDLDLAEFVEADGLFGPPTDFLSDTLAFSLLIGPDDFDDLFIAVDAGGFTEAIPAPGGVVILLAGLTLIRYRRT